MTSRPSLAADNKGVYSTVEFERWIGRTDLDPDEQYVITHYLDPKVRTLEAGTGGGRILLAMRKMGFTNLHGFDYVPEFIAQARASDVDGAIRFEVKDATQLDYPDASFDQALYVQQILNFIEGESRRRQALRQALRVLRPGGIALFSFLSFDVRSRSRGYSLYLKYLRLLRAIRRSRRDPQLLPWLRLGDRFHFGALWDRGPYVYWYRTEQAVRELEDAGFRIRAVGTSLQIQNLKLCDTVAELLEQPMHGALYCVCERPQP